MLREKLPRGKRRLCINMDETSVKLRPPSTRGWLVHGARKKLRRGALACHGRKGDLRCNLTQLVFICDDDEIQRALPTILIVSNKVFSEASIREAKATLPPHIHLWSQPSAWVSGPTMGAACRLLARCLEPWRQEVEVIFIADTYKGHLTKNVWDTLARLHFAYMLIPAKLTWALQPCDTHVFATYKEQLMVEHQLRQIRNADEERKRHRGLSPPPAAMPGKLLGCMLEAVAAAFEKTIRRNSWSHAFVASGLGPHVEDVSSRVLEQLGFSSVPRGFRQWPTISDFEHIFPARADIPVDSIFAFVRRQPIMVGPRRPRPARPLRSEITRPITRSVSGSIVAGDSQASDSAPCPMMAPAPTAGTALSPPPRRIPTAVRLGPPRR